MGRHGQDCSGSAFGQVAGFCECGNEPSCSIKCGEFLDWVSVSFSGRPCSMLLVRPRAEISRRTNTLTCQSNSSRVHHWARTPQVYHRSYRRSVEFTFYISILRVILKTLNTKKGKAHEQMALYRLLRTSYMHFAKQFYIHFLSIAVLCPLVFYDTPKRWRQLRPVL